MKKSKMRPGIQSQDAKTVGIFTDQFVNCPVYPIPAWDKRS